MLALHARLRTLGYEVDAGPEFTATTEASVRRFQSRRGIRSDGICGPQTWGGLDECGFALGDRLLAQRRPLLRGDDIGELQHRLGALGFDAGRPDGIFGAQTEHALREFQRNAGIAADGVCGPQTLTTLGRLDSLAAGSVAAVREHESLHRGPRGLAGRRIALAGAGRHRELLDDLADQLRSGAGAVSVTFDPDDSAACRDANRFAADLFVAIRDHDASAHRCSYYGTPTFKSVGGHSHACYLARAIDRVFPGARVEPRSYALLRETAMAAVVVHASIAEIDHAGTGALATVLADGIRRGFEGDPIPPLG